MNDLKDLLKGQGHSFRYQSISRMTSCRLSILVTFALERTV